MKLTMVGTGYVGLVTGVGFANLGNDVICLDVDKKKIDLLNQGKLTLYEPGLEEIFLRNLKGCRLVFTSDPQKAYEHSDIIFICVGTPTKDNLEADLSAVDRVAADIGHFMNAYKIIVNKSTVPVGTADRVCDLIKQHQTHPHPFDVVSNPEFLREGAALKDFENPDRIIIGTSSKQAQEMMAALYRSLARTGRPIMITDIRSAELIKYASNAMLATRISFVNQLGYLCEQTGADITAVSKGMGLDSRIGARFLHAGIGYGGSCFPKDVKALISTLKNFNCSADLFEAVNRINESQKTIVVDRLKSIMDLRNKTIAIWGISFKPKTDDIREAPALDIISQLQSEGARIQAFDPIAMDNAKVILKDVVFLDDPYETVKNCDALIVVTEWDVFRNLDFRKVKSLLANPVIIDGRNIYNPDDMCGIGFIYWGVGRGWHRPETRQ
jgi:UDPglucose 6-dehydrogenase